MQRSLGGNLERVVGVEPNSTQFGKLVSHLGLTRVAVFPAVMQFVYHPSELPTIGRINLFKPTAICSGSRTW